MEKIPKVVETCGKNIILGLAEFVHMDELSRGSGFNVLV